MTAFRVRVEKDYTVFSAGHFITYDGHLCESLHGHNYRAAAALEGPLDENFYVFDFTRLKQHLKAIVDRLDHRMLLPAESERIKVREDGDHIVATYKDKRYVFPAADVVLLTEVDKGMARSGNCHPLSRLAGRLGHAFAMASSSSNWALATIRSGWRRGGI